MSISYNAGKNCKSLDRFFDDEGNEYDTSKEEE